MSKQKKNFFFQSYSSLIDVYDENDRHTSIKCINNFIEKLPVNLKQLHVMLASLTQTASFRSEQYK